MAEKEERAVWEEIAVRLVLGLPEWQIAIPEIGRTREESQRIDSQIELGVGRNHPRRLCETQHKGNQENAG